MGLKGFTETSVNTQKFKERLILEDGNERFYRNVGNYATIQRALDP
jgi:hypothetical protein